MLNHVTNNPAAHQIFRFYHLFNKKYKLKNIAKTTDNISNQGNKNSTSFFYYLICVNREESCFSDNPKQQDIYDLLVKSMLLHCIVECRTRWQVLCVDCWRRGEELAVLGERHSRDGSVVWFSSCHSSSVWTGLKSLLFWTCLKRK